MSPTLLTTPDQAVAALLAICIAAFVPAQVGRGSAPSHLDLCACVCHVPVNRAHACGSPPPQESNIQSIWWPECPAPVCAGLLSHPQQQAAAVTHCRRRLLSHPQRQVASGRHAVLALLCSCSS